MGKSSITENGKGIQMIRNNLPRAVSRCPWDTAPKVTEWKGSIQRYPRRAGTSY